LPAGGPGGDALVRAAAPGSPADIQRVVGRARRGTDGRSGPGGGAVSCEVWPVYLNPAVQAQALGTALTRLGFTAKVLKKGGRQ